MNKRGIKAAEKITPLRKNKSAQKEISPSPIKGNKKSASRGDKQSK